MENKRIWLRFSKPRQDLLDKARKVPGSIFVGPSKGGPAYRYPFEFKVCQDLKTAFGQEVAFSDELITWGKEEVRKARELLSLSNTKEGVDLLYLPAKLPHLYETLRPDQKAGVKFIATCKNPYVCDHPGLGKTRQVIGGIFEDNMEHGSKLIIAPKTSLDAVWLEQLTELQDQPVFVADEGRRARDKLMDELQIMHEMDEPFWLVINPAMMTLRLKKGDIDEWSTNEMDNYEFQFPFLHEIFWNVVVVDEATKAAMNNTQSVTAKGIRKLNSTKRIAMDGTPVRGKPINVWAVLNWLEPSEYKSKHRWADQWLDNEILEYNVRGGHGKTAKTKKFGSIKNGDEEAFYRAHSKHILRRTKKEVMPYLPDKMYLEVWCTMGDEQRRQYDLMHDKGQMQLEQQEAEDGVVNTMSLLAQYTREKQFANAYCEVDYDDMGKMVVVPTTDSCKLDQIMEKLDELGITDKDYDSFSDEEKEQVVIASQFSTMVDMVADYLNANGVPTLKITGDVKRADRRSNMQKFQAGGQVRAMCITTTAGGVSIDLDRASNVFIIDETWVPDEQEQLTDRCHRASRIHQVIVTHFRTRNTIEEDIKETNRAKQAINDAVLDIYRKQAKASATID